MNIQQQSREVYIHRINRVVDYIEANLTRDHSVKTLAEVAHFSPYHFHRIFRALTGETINNYVKRIRLQAAGSRLLNDHSRPVNEIAVLCGFNSTEVFCRAFREHFGKSASEFRKHHRQQVSKNSQTGSNNGKPVPGSPMYISDDIINQNRNVNMEKNIQVKEMPAMDLVYCRHIGAYNQIGGAYEKLFRWAGPRGLLRFPSTKTLTVYHDDPNVVDVNKVRQSACITVEDHVKTEGEFGNMHLPRGTYAVGSFKVDASQFGEAWDAVCRWIADNGYQPDDGYPYEYYPEEHSGDPPVFTVDICVPVKPL